MAGAFSYRGEDAPRARRLASMALTVAAHLLIIWLLLRLGPALVPPSDEPSLNTFDVSPPAPGPVAAPAPKRAAPKPAPAGGAPAAARVIRTPTPSPSPAPEATATGPSLLALDFDLGKMPRRGSGEGEADGAGRGESAAVYGPGAGPGGERLYAADWQREPTSAELDGYLPNGAPAGSWAMIACRTIPGNQVENCRVLGEGPPGSGLARAMRQAAWQFRILPPRTGGKPILGAWVRIRFDWTAGEMRAR